MNAPPSTLAAPVAEPRPGTRVPPPLNAPGVRLQAYATSELSIAIACLGQRGSRRHEGVHQARKSIRRARAALALGADALGHGARLVDRQLRRINRALSDMRDAQALVEALARVGDKPHGGHAAALIKRAGRAAITRRAARTRQEMHDDPDFAGKRAELGVLAAGLQALPWRALSDADLLASLAASAAKAEAAGQRARRSGQDDDWHQWRRRARRLSQQHRALGDMAATTHGSKQDKAIAVRLGEAQDYALLIDHCRSGSPFKHADRDPLQALAKKGLKRARTWIAKAADSGNVQA